MHKLYYYKVSSESVEYFLRKRVTTSIHTYKLSLLYFYISRMYRNTKINEFLILLQRLLIKNSVHYNLKKHVLIYVVVFLNTLTREAYVIHSTLA